MLDGGHVPYIICDIYLSHSLSNRVIFYFIMTFGRELVVLLVKPSMFGKF